MATKDLFNFYFNRSLDKEIFDRVSEKCYLPSNEILLRLIDEFKGEKKRVKVTFSLSGTFIEQCEALNPDLLDSFRQLAQTGCVEFLNQTHYHSLASLLPDKAEFIDQVRLHHEAIKGLIGFDALVFENTELIYNNEIARIASELGYRGIFAEGTRNALGWRSPNYVYEAEDAGIKLLLRQYNLSDDIGFRFSLREWNEWPLTADKYASWLARTPGQCINIFLDYETFGEHQWSETGIHEFLENLPREIVKRKNLDMATPTEVIVKHKPVGKVSVPVDSTTSWSGVTRDLTSWLGNQSQIAYYEKLAYIAPLVRESKDPNLIRIWRCFGTSDHFHSMFAAGGPVGVVHYYFSPYGGPSGAFITCQSSLCDFEARVRATVVAADEPFLFYYGAGKEKFTGIRAWSLEGFIDAVKKVGLPSLVYHNNRGDFEMWAYRSLYDNNLAEGFKQIRLSKITVEMLRDAIVKLAEASLARARKLA